MLDSELPTGSCDSERWDESRAKQAASSCKRSRQVKETASSDCWPAHKLSITAVMAENVGQVDDKRDVAASRNAFT